MTGVRPRIALTLSRPSALQEASHKRYRDALEGAGADLVVLHPGDPIPSDVDGVCISGGGDIDSTRYGAVDIACADVDRDRDALEIEIAKSAIERDLPILGICRGFQILNVVCDGSLVQDVPGHRPEEREGLVEHLGVAVRPGSRLAKATGGAPLDVNSRSRRAPRSWRVFARPTHGPSSRPHRPYATRSPTSSRSKEGPRTRGRSPSFSKRCVWAAVRSGRCRASLASSTHVSLMASACTPVPSSSSGSGRRPRWSRLSAICAAVATARSCCAMPSSRTPHGLLRRRPGRTRLPST